MGGDIGHNYPDGTIMALGTLNNPGHNHSHQTMLAMGSNTLMPYGHKRAPATYATQSATLLRSSNHSYNSGVFQVWIFFSCCARALNSTPVYSIFNPVDYSFLIIVLRFL